MRTAHVLESVSVLRPTKGRADFAWFCGLRSIVHNPYDAGYTFASRQGVVFPGSSMHHVRVHKLQQAKVESIRVSGTHKSMNVSKYVDMIDDGDILLGLVGGGRQVRVEGHAWHQG